MISNDGAVSGTSPHDTNTMLTDDTPEIEHVSTINLQDTSSINDGRVLHCLHDGYPIDGRIYYYPLECKENRVWVLQGYFCSLSCAKAYVISNIYYGYGILSLFSKMCIDIYNQQDVSLPMSKKCLRHYSRQPSAINIDVFRTSLCTPSPVTRYTCVEKN